MTQVSWVKIYACRCREEQKPAKQRGCLSVFSVWTPVPDSLPTRRYIPDLCPSCHRLSDLRQRYRLLGSSQRNQQGHRPDCESAGIDAAVGGADSAPQVSPAVPTVPTVRLPRPVVQAPHVVSKAKRGADAPRPSSLPNPPRKLQKRRPSTSSDVSRSPKFSSSSSSNSSRRIMVPGAKAAATRSGLRVDTAPRRPHLPARVLGMLTPRAMESDESFVCQDARRIESGGADADVTGSF